MGRAGSAAPGEVGYVYDCMCTLGGYPRPCYHTAKSPVASGWAATLHQAQRQQHRGGASIVLRLHCYKLLSSWLSTVPVQWSWWEVCHEQGLSSLGVVYAALRARSPRSKQPIEPPPTVTVPSTLQQQHTTQRSRQHCQYGVKHLNSPGDWPAHASV